MMAFPFFLSLSLSALIAHVCTVQAALYSDYILAPTSRTLRPASVRTVNGTVTGTSSLTTTSGSAVFHGVAGVTYDFGKNVEGIVSFNVATLSGIDQFVGVTFSESSLWISGAHSDATADAGFDEVLWFAANAAGFYSASPEHRRGAFRYLSVVTNATGSLTLSNLTIHFTAFPNAADNALGEYSGYFHCNDDKLNRVWYAGAYTDQLCTIDPNAGNSLVHLGVITSSTVVNTTDTWYNNYTISSGTSVLVDGAKRDRLVWPGDYVIALPSTFVSTNDISAIKNGLNSLFALQNSTGALPYSGIPFYPILQGILGDSIFSFTYHLHNIISAYYYYLYSGDLAYLKQLWPQIKLGLEFSLSHVDSTGLQYVTTSPDWLRFGMGGHNIEANAILYRTLELCLTLGNAVGDTSSNARWISYRTNIKSAANNLLWDNIAGLYRDNETTTLHPQDGNTWAVVSGLPNNASQTSAISAALRARWGPYGAPAPEAGATVSPFISGFELQAHFLAGNPQNAIDLMRTMFCDFMLDDPRMTNSTFNEGYSTDGSLHYAPYVNDPRISHAHGWSTGSTSALSFFVGGIQLTSASGQTWLFAPQPGNLTSVKAGYQTALGSFSADLELNSLGLIYTFSAPKGTSGSVRLAAPKCAHGLPFTTLVQIGNVHGPRPNPKGGQYTTQIVEFDDLPGGNWVLQVQCSGGGWGW